MAEYIKRKTAIEKTEAFCDVLSLNGRTRRLLRGFANSPPPMWWKCCAVKIADIGIKHAVSAIVAETTFSM